MSETTQAIWDSLVALPRPTLTALFEAEPGRLDTLSIAVPVGDAELYTDLAKTHLDSHVLGGFLKLAEAMDLEGARAKLFAGDIVNPSEGRAAEHMAERGIGNEEAVEMAAAASRRMAGLIEAIDGGALGEIRHILHIGIGGSALGPKLVFDALGRDDARYDVAVVSNVDGAALEEACKRFDPKKTLVAIASKTFTTSETMLNAASAMEWLRDGGVDDPYGKVVALTASPEKAMQWGVDETRILPFSETVGGRYSIWSSIGFPVALALGVEAFEEFRRGAAIMDRHFRDTPFERNLPVLAAFADLYYAQVRGCQTRAIFAYDERLRLLPDYLQQLEMESNGKSVTAEGEPLGRASAAIGWGGVGTDAQHAVFQLLHQGTHLVPVEFLAAAAPEHGLDDAHHRALLINCFAQGAALMAGQESDDGHRRYPGDRPSLTLLLDRLTPATMGALIAFYEHRTFANAALLGINPFDQFGVELGKAIAKSLDSSDRASFDPSTENLISRAEL